MRCLQDKGYARTTARDIATASHANLASISYHFGSKETLLNEALMAAFMQWTEQLGTITLADIDTSPPRRLGAVWTQILAGFDENRGLVVAFVEAMAQTAHSEDLRTQMAEHYQALRATVATITLNNLGDDQGALAAEAPTIAATLIALCDGFALQWLIDPQNIPDLRPLLDAIDTLSQPHSGTFDTL